MASPGIESYPLENRGNSRAGGTLFEELDPMVMGLSVFTNNYTGPEVWTRRWREYILGTIGTGIALGDIDGDRYPDLFVASKDEESRLFRNVNGARFEDVTKESGILDSSDPASGVAMVDIDNDGDLDLYLCFVGGVNELWINDGAGRFEERGDAWGVAISNGCTMASFADYDRDGDLDFYLQNNLLNDGPKFEKLEDQLFENLGDRFAEVTESAGISGEGHGHSALWWDFNEDGWPDIYVANDFSDLDKLYRNNKDGTFTDVLSEVMPQVPYYSMGADFGDINNDGQSDYWVADMAATSREHHIRTVGTHRHVYNVGMLGQTHQSLKNALLLKSGPSSFAEIGFLSGLARTDWTWAARLVDLNNDGWLDAFATNGMLRSFHDGDLGSKQARASHREWMKLVFRNEPVLRERNLAYENLGDMQFSDRSEDWGVDKLGVSFGVAFGDIDLDGDLDFVLNNFDDEVSVFRNDEARSNRITLRLVGDDSNRFGLGARVVVTCGDLVQTKELSSMRGYMSTDEPILHFGLAEHESIETLEVLWPSGKRQFFEELEANAHYIIREETSIGRREPTGARTLFTQKRYEFPEEASRSEQSFGDFVGQPLLPFAESRDGGDVALEDFNQDGTLDVLLSGATGQESCLLLNRGDASFEYSLPFDFQDDFGCEDTDLVVGDLDEDGDLDLLISSGGVELDKGDSFYADRYYLNVGEGEFERDFDAGISEKLASTQVIAMSQKRGDGSRSVFAGGKSVPREYPYAAESSLWRFKNGVFEEVEVSWMDRIARVSDATWADFDGDGDEDLVILQEWGAPLYISDTGESYELIEEMFDSSVHSGWWSEISVADFDGDGLLDVFAGNLGLNSEYEAVAEAPIRLWYSDRADGEVKLIETSLDSDNREWSREVRWRLQQSFPAEVNRFRSYEAFAKQDFQSLFPEIRSKRYEYKEIQELRSGVFWQGADGRFTFEPLPSFAQSGKVRGVLSHDLDGDGATDLLLSLEQPSPEPWAKRFEKGHLALFLNAGGRVFRTVLAKESGLGLSGYPRGMAWGDLDGNGLEELVVTQSSGQPVVYELSAPGD
ncbi:VCBS repeat-containing protein [Pelagicoccus mobilis]|uniref:VCBS repeat-containing protein n=1 Tax=Pelagicoccus mobilis TaxID=415221 RepID=A0A934S294_9BACT|nr:VCBS repeat-containing protein [Pelagicoccus mobilis]MBK1879749.1 VCBS repeat-containing protein [Pelagicoccus mobilis]